ncbi:MAG TPA: alpha-ribazole phosphatase [Phycisphaerales bacterium]|nr:alpha-ribazole phosphatase [Phycisphaerales bacterium]
MGKILLIRHGETEMGNPPRYCGSTDAMLSERGKDQAKLIAERLADTEIDTLIVSPMTRCQHTAKEISKLQSAALDAETVDDLREVDFGEWEGLSFDEICREFGEESKEWFANPNAFRFPGGESVEEFTSRVSAATERVVGREGTVAVVVHAGVIKVMICHLCGFGMDKMHSFSLSAASLSVLNDYKGLMVIRSVNDTCHLNAKGEG